MYLSSNLPDYRDIAATYLSVAKGDEANHLSSPEGIFILIRDQSASLVVNF